MACCLLAAMVIANVIALWKKITTLVRSVKNWFTGKPETTNVSVTPITATPQELMRKR